MTHYSIAQALKNRLSLLVEIKDFRIFGSRARGDQEEYSDLDIYIVVDTLNRELKKKISTIVWEIGYENYMVISPLVYTVNEIQNTPIRSSPILKNILAEGISV